MFAELLSWGFIATLYIAAFAILRLEKHWHRTAEVFFTLATLLVIFRLMLWVWINADGFLGGVAFVAGISAVISNIWFVRKVERDIPKQAEGRETAQTEPQKVDAPSSQNAARERDLQSRSLEPGGTEYTRARPRAGQVIDQRAWRLRTDQKEQLIAFLKPEQYPPVISLRYRNTDMEACEFVQDFREVFSEAGWRIVNDHRYADYDTRQGLFVETMWNHIPPSGAHRLANALKDAGLTVTLKTSRSVRCEDEVVLFVGGIED